MPVQRKMEIKKTLQNFLEKAIEKLNRRLAIEKKVFEINKISVN